MVKVGTVIPPYKPDPIVVRKFRFVCTSAVSATTITRANLLNLLFTAGSASAAYRQISAIRLTRVLMWGVADTTPDELSPISISWLGDRSPDVSHNAYGNAMNPAHLSLEPPVGSLAGCWSVGGAHETEQMFIINAVKDTVIDLCVEVVYNEGACTVLAGSGFTAGSTYYNYLDGTALAAGVIKPGAPYNFGQAA